MEWTRCPAKPRGGNLLREQGSFRIEADIKIQDDEILRVVPYYKEQASLLLKWKL